MILKRKLYSTESKVLGVISPGSWHAKEAMKFAYDDPEEYKRERDFHAAVGTFTPLTAMHMRRKAAEMRRQGKSAEEVKEYIDKNAKLAGSAEIVGGVLTGGLLPAAGEAAAGLSGLRAKATGRNRRVYGKDVKKTKK